MSPLMALLIDSARSVGVSQGSYPNEPEKNNSGQLLGAHLGGELGFLFGTGGDLGFRSGFGRDRRFFGSG